MRRSTFKRVWLAPLIMALLSLFGLVVALLADGWGDLLSWLALGVPVWACFYYGLRTGSD